MIWEHLLRFLFGKAVGRLAERAVDDPLDPGLEYGSMEELDMPDYALQEEMTIAELGEFCIALAGSVEKGFALGEGVRVGRRAVDLKVGRHSLLHFHLWEGADCHELQVRMLKVAPERVAMHFLCERWAAGKVVGALNAAKGPGAAGRNGTSAREE